MPGVGVALGEQGLAAGPDRHRHRPPAAGHRPRPAPGRRQGAVHPGPRMGRPVQPPRLPRPPTGQQRQCEGPAHPGGRGTPAVEHGHLGPARAGAVNDRRPHEPGTAQDQQPHACDPVTHEGWSTCWTTSTSLWTSRVIGAVELRVPPHHDRAGCPQSPGGGQRLGQKGRRAPHVGALAPPHPTARHHRCTQRSRQDGRQRVQRRLSPSACSSALFGAGDRSF